jgi:hypothetical protein
LPIFSPEELVTHMDRKLTCDESEDLEKDLTINEIKKIIFSMKQYKSPGLDGIINEFYRSSATFLSHPSVENRFA